MSSLGIASRRSSPSRADVSLSGGTLTAAGFIPHLLYRNLRCPVVLEVVELANGRQLYTDARGMPFPDRTRGALRFALPGGGFVVGPRGRGR